MDVLGVVTGLAGELITHRGKLEGRAGEPQRAQAALESAADAVLEQCDVEKKESETALGHWSGDAAAGFEKKSKALRKDLTTTAEAATRAAKIIPEVASSLDGRHATVGKLIDEFMTKASQFLKAGLAAVGIAAPAGLMKAMAGASDLANRYIQESGGQLKDARAELEEAARKLRELQKEMDADGVADPKKDEGKGEQGDDSGSDGGSGGDNNSDKVDKILDNAREHLGYQEGANNQNKWGPTGQPWCSYFATSMWEEAGVDINPSEYGFTGKVYERGQDLGTAYDQGEIAEQARPGDAILFGSGPEQGNSRHIGVIEKVEDNKITTIEGNASDQVMRKTYTLPEDRDEFYGGVHPK